MLGADGEGFDIMMGVVLPLFNVLNAACSVGLMDSAVAPDHRTRERASVTQHTGAVARRPADGAHLHRAHADQDRHGATRSSPTRSRPLEGGRADAMLRVLESKAAAGEAATEVLDLAMRVCGGAAFRKDVGVERSSATRARRASWRRPPTCSTTSSARPSAACRCSEEP